MTPSPSPWLRLEGVSKSFGPRLLFRGVNADFPPGTVSLLTGANGTGKSTLMRIMAGLSRPDEGKAVCRAKPEKTGYLAHSTFLYPGLTALENLVFWASAMGLPAPAKTARRALARVGLERRAREPSGVFSRGMAQRLNLARLLLADPDLLLLDEPGTGLDGDSRLLLLRIVAEARDRGAAVVWISHDRKEDGPLADRIFSLENRAMRRETDGPATPAAGETMSAPPC
jgi:heme exporter protein A